jgi:Zn-finger nucleic acid-binding protein
MTEAANAAPTCPRCDSSLTQGQSNNARVWGCLRCGGIWLDHDTSQRVATVLDRDLMFLADGAARVAASAGDASRAWVLCPVCKINMRPTKIEVAQCSVDVCREHGAWFDRNELQQVMTALVRLKGRAGGGGPSYDAAAAALAGGPAHQADADSGGSTAAVVGEVAVDVTVGALSFLLDW